MIEVAHDSINLPCKLRVFVRNVLRADKRIRALMDERRSRGMRLRYIPDYQSRSYYLEARDSEAVRIALQCLRNDGNVLSTTKHYRSLAAA